MFAPAPCYREQDAKMERGDDAKTAFVTASIMLVCNNLVA
jgi:hypothetical protein